MSDYLQPYKKHFLTLVEAGFMAINESDEKNAIDLFSAAMLLNPNNSLPQIGMGYMYLCKLELKKAAQTFQEVLSKESSNEMAKALLGFTLAISPDKVSEGEKYLMEGVKSHNKDVSALSNLTIDFVDRFVKKPTPMNVQQQKKQK